MLALERITMRLLFIFTFAFSLACQKQEITDAEKASKIFEEYYQLKLDRSPFMAGYADEKIHMDRFDDFSETYQKETLNLNLKLAEKLKNEVNYEKLNRRTKIHYDLMLEAIANEEKGFKWRYHAFAVDHMAGLHSRLPNFLKNYHPVENLKDMENYISRLSDIDRLFDQVIENMNKQAKKGVILPKHSLEKIKATLEGMIANDKMNVYYKGLEKKLEKLKADDEKKSKLKSKAQSIIDTEVLVAHKKFLKSINELIKISKSDIGSWQFTDGKDFYQFMLETATTTKMTAPEVHQLGLNEVKRIHGEIKDIMKKVKFKGSIQDFFKFTKTDSQFYYPDTKAGQDRYMKEAKQLILDLNKKLPLLFEELPPIDVKVVPVPKYAEKASGLAYYQRPSPDGKRPGQYFVNLKSMKELPTFEMEALAYHEGIPGHHLQSLYDIKTRDTNPKFMQLIWHTAHGEGWGLYSEYIPKEYGAYKDPYSDYGRLTMELWRACRLVLDTGIHHFGWTREKAAKFLADNTPSADSANIVAVDRYTVWPGQATAYLIGKNKILELKKMAEAKLGNLFDIREFHREVLQYGSIPLSIIEELINEYVQSKGQKTPSTNS